MLGVSADPPAKLARWAQKKEFPYPLLGDEDHGTLGAWGAWAMKSFMGKRFEGVVRSTFLVGRDGRIAKAWPKASPIGHARDVLSALKALQV